MAERNIVLGCEYQDHPLDCPMCANECCRLCGAGCWSDVRDCEHDIIERHMEQANDITE